MLFAAHEAGRLQFFGDHAHLAGKAAFKALLANGNRPGNIAHARQLLALPARPKEPETPEAALEQPARGRVHARAAAAA